MAQDREQQKRSEVAYVLFFGLPVALIAFVLSVGWHVFFMHERADRGFFISQATIWSLAGIVSGFLTRRAQKKRNQEQRHLPR